MDKEAPAQASETTDVERSVQQFYDGYGWIKTADGLRGEDKTYRDFRAPYYPYAEGSRARTEALFPPTMDRLLIAGCGDMPASHVAIAGRADNVSCVDISDAAIAIARERLARPIEAEVASILDMPFADNRFAAAFCAHVLYHINGDDQAKAVRELIRVTQPGGRIVILYFNPASPLRAASAAVTRLRKLIARPKPGAATEAPALYFKSHGLGWWTQFSDRCTVSILPWEPLSSKVERSLLPGDGVARLFYRAAAALERRAPALASRLWMFPIIVLDKRVAGPGPS